MNYDSLPDAGFRKQYDVTPKDSEVEALLAGIEPEKVVAKSTEPTKIEVSIPAPQFRWLQPLR